MIVIYRKSLTKYVLRESQLTHSLTMHPFSTPENIGKLYFNLDLLKNEGKSKKNGSSENRNQKTLQIRQNKKINIKDHLRKYYLEIYKL